MIALPQSSMTATRTQARADLVQLFEHSFSNELEDVLDMWWDDDTQATLRSLVERLKKKG